ncbi:MAG: hypothetical protein FJ191_13410 [Gammaproteobacteria bacterium]|nr:hypothetical protein [Gammaproteobacteria bacterium]
MITPRRARPARIDPQLAAVLKQTTRGPRALEAYVTIRSPKTGAGAAAARTVLSRVARRTGTRALRAQYLELLDAIHVAAPRAFLRELCAQPEVIAASLPPQVAGSAMIEPVNPRRVSAKSAGAAGRRGVPA